MGFVEVLPAESVARSGICGSIAYGICS
jgi:hypothetical protein